MNRYGMRTVLVLLALIIFPVCGRAFDSTASLRISVAVSPQPSAEDVSAFTIAPALVYRHDLGGSIYIGLDWGASFVALQREGLASQSRIDLGNPLVGIGYRFSALGGVQTDIAVRAGIPLATFPGSIPDNRLSEFNFNNAVSAHGWRNPFVWLMNVVPVVFDVEMKGALARDMTACVKVSPAMLVSVNRQPSRVAVSGSVDVDKTFDAVKLRAGWAYFFSGLSIENNNSDQHSLRAGVDVGIAGVSTLAADVHVNIDEPNGVAADAPKPAWGIVLGYSVLW